MSELFPLHDSQLPMDASSLKAAQVQVALQQLKAPAQDSTAHNVSGCRWCWQRLGLGYSLASPGSTYVCGWVCLSMVCLVMDTSINRLDVPGGACSSL